MSRDARFPETCCMIVGTVYAYGQEKNPELHMWQQQNWMKRNKEKLETLIRDWSREGIDL